MLRRLLAATVLWRFCRFRRSYPGIVFATIIYYDVIMLRFRSDLNSPRHDWNHEDEWRTIIIIISINVMQILHKFVHNEEMESEEEELPYRKRRDTIQETATTRNKLKIVSASNGVGCCSYQKHTANMLS